MCLITNVSYVAPSSVQGHWRAAAHKTPELLIKEPSELPESYVFTSVVRKKKKKKRPSLGEVSLSSPFPSFSLSKSSTSPGMLILNFAATKQKLNGEGRFCVSAHLLTIALLEGNKNIRDMKNESKKRKKREHRQIVELFFFRFGRSVEYAATLPAFAVVAFADLFFKS